jgi:thymidylate synthase ThyX
VYQAKVILDSVGIRRLTTMELTYPRFVHSEFMTHRQFSRNAASSRAIPIDTMLQKVMDDPVIPVSWGKNQKGMQAEEELDEEVAKEAEACWLLARDQAVAMARVLQAKGVHKQLVNRITEPWMYITVVVTATEWSNFFSLRCHKDAQPEIKHIADMAHAAYAESTPVSRFHHIPYCSDDEIAAHGVGLMQKASVARCARVSVLQHDGSRSIDKDLVLYQRLLKGSGFGHWSPFEHVASKMDHSHLNYEEVQALVDRTGPAVDWAIACRLLNTTPDGLMLTSFGRRLVDDVRSGNFVGWIQYRKKFLNECQ